MIGFPPPSATVQVAFGAHSSRGRSRPVNTDNYLVCRLGRSQETLLTSLPNEVMSPRFDEYGYGMVVADGMGDTPEGAAASRLAIVTLVHLVRHFGQWSLRIDDAVAREIMERAERYYRTIDTTIKVRQRRGAPRVDQTTLTATFGAGEELIFAHVGHSRAYLLRDGLLMRLTRDHTVGRRHPKRSAVPTAPIESLTRSARDLTHVLTDTIGGRGGPGPTIDIERFHLCDDDCVLVCTNGLTDSLDEGAIAEVLSSPQPPDDQSRALVEHAMTAGGDDDVTALVARYHIPGEVGPP